MKKLFEMEGIKLTFRDDALHAVAKKAIKKGTGARGLRLILEAIMLDIMYEVPSKTNVEECIITKKAVKGLEKPKLKCLINLAKFSARTARKKCCLAMVKVAILIPA